VNSTDKLKFRTLNSTQILKRKIYTILPEYTESEAFIPPQQIADDFKAKIEKYF
jgi:hypothetical protein